MMAEDTADTAVDRAIARLEEAVSELKSSQKKDVAEEDSEEQAEGTPRSKQPSNLKDAGREVRRRFAKARGRKEPRDTQ